MLCTELVMVLVWQLTPANLDSRIIPDTFLWPTYWTERWHWDGLKACLPDLSNKQARMQPRAAEWTRTSQSQSNHSSYYAGLMNLSGVGQIWATTIYCNGSQRPLFQHLWASNILIILLRCRDFLQQQEYHICLTRQHEIGNFTLRNIKFQTIEYKQ